MNIVAKASSEIEQYADVAKNYDHELLALTKDGKSIQYKHYLEMVTTALRKGALKAREGEAVEQELVRIGLFAEDTGIAEALPEWLQESLESNRPYFNTIYRHYNYADDRREEEEEDQKREVKPDEFTGLKEIMTEAFKKSDPISEVDLALEVDKLKSLRAAQLQELIDAVTQKFMNSEVATKTDVLIALGENKTLKQLLTIYLARLDISVVTTAIAQGDKEVVSKRTNFEPSNAGHYSLETLRNGLALANGRIEDLLRIEQDFEKSDSKIKSLESEKNQATKEAARARSEVESYKKLLEIERTKPGIKDAKALLYRIAWDDEGVRYYLGSTSDADDVTKEGTYKIASLIKSTDKRDSIKFTDINAVQKQLEKAILYYAKIDRKQIISLESLKNAYVLELLEFENKSFFKAKVVRSHS